MNEEGLKVLPESIHDWNEVKESDTPEKFWDQMKNLKSKIGTGLYQPSKEAGKEDWAKFIQKAVDLSDGKMIPSPNLEDKEQRDILYKTLGKPSESAEYEFETIEGIPDLSDERKEFISKTAFDLNLTKSQLKALDKTIREADGAVYNKHQATVVDGLRDLKQDWGLASDDRMNQAMKVAKVFFPHLGDTPSLTADEFKAFFALSKQLGSKATGEFSDQGDQGNLGTSPADAIAKIAEIRNNKEHPYNNPKAHGHDVAKKEMRNLYLAKNGQVPE